MPSKLKEFKFFQTCITVTSEGVCYETPSMDVGRIFQREVGRGFPLCQSKGTPTIVRPC